MMRHWYRKQSVLTQMMLLVAASLALLLTMFFVITGRTINAFRRTNEEYLNNLATQLSNTISANYTNYSKIMRLASYNGALQSFLLCEDEVERFTYFVDATRNLSDAAAMNDQIIDIVFTDRDSQRYNLGDNFYPLPDMDLSDNALHVSNLQQTQNLTSSAAYLVLGREIRSSDRYRQTNQWIGNLYLILQATAFTGSERSAEYSGNVQIYFVDGSDHILWVNSPEYGQDSLQAVLEKADPQIYYTSTEIPSLAPFQIIACQQKAFSLLRELDWQTGYLFTLLLAVLFILLLWFAWVRNLAKPMTQLKGFVEQIGKEELSGLSASVTLQGYQEAEVIGDEITHMLHQIHDLTEDLFKANSDLYESELLARQSELSHLRSQINPHFLYNTLETMVGIAYTHEQPELAEIARSLSIIFKYSIKGDDVVPLKVETKITRNYIHIQHYRFSDRFEALYDIDEECLGDMVPKLILQPLIENAIVHGIEQQQQFCTLTVSAHHIRDMLVLTVQDNGAGIAPARLAALQTKLAESVHSAARVGNTSHIGVVNVDSRIKLMYGAPYGIQIDSELGKGTKVTIKLPRKEGDVPCIR